METKLNHEAFEHPQRGVLQRLKHFLMPFDGRFEDLRGGSWKLNVLRDLMAGLIVAMVAIPLAMGFAMASGLRPEQGIVGGAVAGLIGALFGGSKYQVYGPTAAFIPVIAAIMAKHGQEFLILCSLLAGALLMLMGVAGLGKIVAKVPHSIVVGFTMGIAVVIALSQLGEVLGIHAKLSYEFMEKMHGIWHHLGDTNPYAVAIALGTFAISKILLRVSVFIPAPLIGVGLGTLVASTVWSGHHLLTVKDKFGEIPRNLLVFTPPDIEPFTATMAYDLLSFTVAILFVSAVESLLCSRMADRLADNRGLPYHPDKELWGQGLVQIAVPLLNGFPHTGALARTATNIKLGALSPLAGIFKCVLKLALAFFLASYLEMVPMACIGGILLYVASGMVKPSEVREVFTMKSRFHLFLMFYTAVMVVATDFLKGVLSAVILYAILHRFFPLPSQEGAEAEDGPPSPIEPELPTGSLS